MCRGQHLQPLDDSYDKVAVLQPQQWPHGTKLGLLCCGQDCLFKATNGLSVYPVGCGHGFWISTSCLCRDMEEAAALGQGASDLEILRQICSTFTSPLLLHQTQSPQVCVSDPFRNLETSTFLSKGALTTE